MKITKEEKLKFRKQLKIHMWLNGLLIIVSAAINFIFNDVFLAFAISGMLLGFGTCMFILASSRYYNII